MRPTDNPPNRFHATHVEWDEGEAPPAELEVFEERAKSILNEVTSPDIPARWGLNPYRGCSHACAYCLSGDTPILMGDGRLRALAEVRAGDEVYGTVPRGRFRRYVKTRVVDHWRTEKPAYRVSLEDGTTLVASGDHRFLSGRGWKHVTGAMAGAGQRPYLTLNDELRGTGAFTPAGEDGPAYRRGYLCGLIRGDGTLKGYEYERAGRAHGRQYQFRLALIDREALDRAKSWLADFGVATGSFVFQRATEARREIHAIRTQARAGVLRVRDLVAWPERRCPDWSRGFLAGIFDAEGSYSRGIFRISNTDPMIVRQVEHCLRLFGFDVVIEARMPHESSGSERPIMALRVRGGLQEHLRFFHLTDPAITRKRGVEGQAIKNKARLRVARVEPLGLVLPMFDITTGTGDFIANGVVSHNCFARPTHQYLGFGAGTDFDRKIVVKVNAAALLREAFERPSWRGEEVMMSGNTDCYQALEGRYKVTRACLEVFAAYRNPVGVITKGSLVRRDVDLLAELARHGAVSVYVSVPFADDAMRRKVEPLASPIPQRFETLRALSDAGVPCGVSVSPIIPGLNDGDVAKVLEAAHAAGARRAFMTPLRLPGETAAVYDARMAEAFPHRVKRMDSALLQVRRGKRNESAFGERMTGDGPRWEIVRQLFHATCKRLGMNEPEEDRPTPFRRPWTQGSLF